MGKLNLTETQKPKMQKMHEEFSNSRKSFANSITTVNRLCSTMNKNQFSESSKARAETSRREYNCE